VYIQYKQHNSTSILKNNTIVNFKYYNNLDYDKNYA